MQIFSHYSEVKYDISCGGQFLESVGSHLSPLAHLEGHRGIAMSSSRDAFKKEATQKGSSARPSTPG
jgi:hypothetical protein